ncbi:hypothetical protein [Bacillus thuringiensis]|uniref:hypothetical protein n=1 Tax=Bacillus thuringiensis TaxID=1428 RepID=UPI002D80C39F|nr:hypothetical protein [Bacillus thuringiensis]MEB4818363.1 hypothetical protein [Bacillus thuringiensis]
MPNIESENIVLQDSSLLKEIQNGGYILYLRHAKPNNAGEKLSDLGEKQAKQLGGIFKELQIPIQYKVLISPTNRTKETGVIAFGEQNIEVRNSLEFIIYLKSDSSNSEQQQIKEDLIETLETVPTDKFNKVLIAHHYKFDASYRKLPHMGMVVLKPNGPGKGFEFKGLITLDQFIKWSNENNPS